MEDKENTRQIQGEPVNKIWGEPPKVRRSVLKEFDPLASDSPQATPRKPSKLAVHDPIVEDEDIFEDVETSLPTYVGAINSSLLIPELRDLRPNSPTNNQNLSDTEDMLFLECNETISQASRLELTDDSVQFNYNTRKSLNDQSIDDKNESVHEIVFVNAEYDKTLHVAIEDQDPLATEGDSDPLMCSELSDNCETSDDREPSDNIEIRGEEVQRVEVLDQKVVLEASQPEEEDPSAKTDSSITQSILINQLINSTSINHADSEEPMDFSYSHNSLLDEPMDISYSEALSLGGSAIATPGPIKLREAIHSKAESSSATEADSRRSVRFSLPEPSSEDEEQAEKAAQALAESINQTIDAEESAIVDEISSTDESEHMEEAEQKLDSTFEAVSPVVSSSNEEIKDEGLEAKLETAEVAKISNGLNNTFEAESAKEEIKSEGLKVEADEVKLETVEVPQAARLSNGLNRTFEADSAMEPKEEVKNEGLGVVCIEADEDKLETVEVPQAARLSNGLNRTFEADSAMEAKEEIKNEGLGVVCVEADEAKLETVEVPQAARLSNGLNRTFEADSAMEPKEEVKNEGLGVVCIEADEDKLETVEVPQAARLSNGLNRTFEADSAMEPKEEVKNEGLGVVCIEADEAKLETVEVPQAARLSNGLTRTFEAEAAMEGTIKQEIISEDMEIEPKLNETVDIKVLANVAEKVLETPRLSIQLNSTFEAESAFEAFPSKELNNVEVKSKLNKTVEVKGSANVVEEVLQASRRSNQLDSTFEAESAIVESSSKQIKDVEAESRTAKLNETVDLKESASVAEKPAEEVPQAPNQLNTTFEAYTATVATTSEEIMNKDLAVDNLNQNVDIQKSALVAEELSQANQLNNTFEAESAIVEACKEAPRLSNQLNSASADVELKTDSAIEDQTTQLQLTNGEPNGTFVAEATEPPRSPNELNNPVAELSNNELNGTFAAEAAMEAPKAENSVTVDDSNSNQLNGTFVAEGIQAPRPPNAVSEDSATVVDSKPKQRLSTQLNGTYEAIEAPNPNAVSASSATVDDSKHQLQLSNQLNGTFDALANEAVSEDSATKLRPPTKLECRPNIRTLRNRTQVIDVPVILQAALKPEDVLEVKRLQQEKLRLEQELSALEEDNRRKDRCILEHALQKGVFEDSLAKYRRLVEQYEKHIQMQAKELRDQKRCSEGLDRDFLDTELVFSVKVQHYEKAKSVIAAYQKNEEILKQNLENARTALLNLEEKCQGMQDEKKRLMEEAEKTLENNKTDLKTTLKNLQSRYKRLEITVQSLEAALKEKTKECEALAALCEEMTAGQS